LDGASRRLRLLVDHRDDLVTERARVQCRLRWHLHEIASTVEVPSKGMRRDCVVSTVAKHLAGLDGTVAEIARELVGRVAELDRRVNELETQIKPSVAELAPSPLAIPGCRTLTAAKIIGATTGVSPGLVVRRRLSKVGLGWQHAGDGCCSVGCVGWGARGVDPLGSFDG
jgi:hypothetical protein